MRKLASSVEAQAQSDALEAANGKHNRGRRRVKLLTTPSFLDASIRSYKIYSPSTTVQDHDDERLATEALVALQDDGVTNICLNPMRPITQYMYCISVYNSDRTLHYRSAYIIYDNTMRLYYVYSIISNCFPHATAATATAATASGYPAPVHTVQMKYTTNDIKLIVNYIMTMIIPSSEYDYFIQDDIVGIIASKDEFEQTAFSEDSSYYDLDHLFRDNTSCETIYGYKVFHLIPSRKYWFDPRATATATAIWPSYTESVVQSALLIL